MFATTVSTFGIDSIALPTWANDLIHSTRKATTYSNIFIKAFHKTLTPVLVENIKGLSLHWFESERYWRQRITNAAGITHNPLTASIQAAHTELTSAEAHATYRRIRSITREAAMDALVVGLCGVVAVATTIEAAQTVYRHAKRIYGKVYTLLNPSPLPSAEMVKAAEALAAALSTAADVAEAQAEPDFWFEPMPLINTPPVVGPIWNPSPGRDMHEEVQRLLELQHVPLTLAAAPVVEQSEPVQQSARRGRGQTKAADAPPKAEDEPGALDVPGATGGKRQRKAKASTSKAAAAKPERTRGMQRLW